MISHPDATDDDHDNVKLALSTNHAGQEKIPHDLLQKYLMYARERDKFKLHQMDQEKAAKLYSELRRESMATGENINKILLLGHL